MMKEDIFLAFTFGLLLGSVSGNKKGKPIPTGTAVPLPKQPIYQTPVSKKPAQVGTYTKPQIIMPQQRPVVSKPVSKPLTTFFNLVKSK